MANKGKLLLTSLVRVTFHLTLVLVHHVPHLTLVLVHHTHLTLIHHVVSHLTLIHVVSHWVHVPTLHLRAAHVGHHLLLRKELLWVLSITHGESLVSLRRSHRHLHVIHPIHAVTVALIRHHHVIHSVHAVTEALIRHHHVVHTSHAITVALIRHHHTVVHCHLLLWSNHVRRHHHPLLIASSKVS